MTKPAHLQVVDVGDETRPVTDDWRNWVLAEVNDHVVRVSVLRRDFHWHPHDDGDELFYVVEGRLFVDLEERTLELTPGQLVVIPRGVRHRTRPDGRCVNLTLERAATDVRGSGAERA